MQRLLPPRLVALLLAMMVLTTLIVPWPSLSWPARLFGLVPAVAGAILTVRHAQLFEQLGTNIITFDDPDVLVRHGAFAWTRNPMYLGFVLVLVGAAASLGAVVAMAGPILFFVVADRWYIPFEEQRMATTFGTEYDEYARHVHRWVHVRRPR